MQVQVHEEGAEEDDEADMENENMTKRPPLTSLTCQKIMGLKTKSRILGNDQ